MSITRTETRIDETAAFGGFADAVGGIATVVLAVIGLARTEPETLAAIATIVFGAALLIQAGTMLSEYAGIIFPPGATEFTVGQVGGGSMSAVFLGGAAGIILGILAVLGINPGVLVSVAVIIYGAALVVSTSSVWQLHRVKRASLASAERSEASGRKILANELAFGSASVQGLAGIAAIILGIIAVVGNHTLILSLVALLVLGGAIILTGSALGATVLGFMQPAQSGSATRAPAE